MNWSMLYIVAAILLLPALIYGGLSQMSAVNTFDKYSKVASTCGVTASDLTKKLLADANITDVDVIQINGRLSDCYDPRHKVVKLSSSTFNSTSMAALGVCAHEVGHALQDAKGNFLFRLRIALVPVINFISGLYIPLILAGAILSFSLYIDFGYYMSWFAVILYGASTIFQLITLPLEHDASKQALQMLRDTGLFTGGEIDTSKRVLDAAISTYVSALFTSVVFFLRFLSYAMIFKRD